MKKTRKMHGFWGGVIFTKTLIFLRKKHHSMAPRHMKNEQFWSPCFSIFLPKVWRKIFQKRTDMQSQIFKEYTFSWGFLTILENEKANNLKNKAKNKEKTKQHRRTFWEGVFQKHSYFRGNTAHHNLHASPPPPVAPRPGALLKSKTYFALNSTLWASQMLSRPPFLSYWCSLSP